jgi:putative peptidoglycan lipid II flippase
MNDSKGSVSSQFARSALILAIAMVFSQLIGLLSKSLIGSIYGASAEVDAFLASNRLTETLFNLVAGGALGSAFVPAFSALLDQNDKGDAWKLASTLQIRSLLYWFYYVC